MRTIFLLPLALSWPAIATAQPIRGEELIQPTEKELRQLQALTPEMVQAKVKVTDDELEPVATLSTEEAWTGRGRFTDTVRSDNFLRAFINKTSGEVRYQLYQEVRYSGALRRFRTVNYLTEAGPISADLVPIAQDVESCISSMCFYREAVGLVIAPDLLQTIAAQYVPGASPLWRFRLKSTTFDWEDRLAPAEAAGLLRAVGAYRATHHLQ